MDTAPTSSKQRESRRTSTKTLDSGPNSRPPFDSFESASKFLTTKISIIPVTGTPTLATLITALKYASDAAKTQMDKEIYYALALYSERLDTVTQMELVSDLLIEHTRQAVEQAVMDTSAALSSQVAEALKVA